MSNDSWTEIESVFAEAAELDQAERGALLDVRCAGRPELRREIESLLVSHDAVGRFMTVAHASPADPQRVRDHAGEIVGRFRLLERIGEGGMGVVYRAERADGEFAEQVAVKVLSAPIHTTDALRRFRVERQILATLNHPDIVTLLDGGLTEAGLAFLAMKYIDGVPIVEHCTERQLPLPDRIRLFQRACAAVQYAHQQGVVHRDLKPGNILVTPDGLPKILDFGVAKLLDPSGEASDAAATAVFRPMTPNYASPEQVRGLPVTTACDVYALGMLLYELLTGARAYETGGKSLDEMVRLVVETDPVRPSQAVASTSATQPPYDLRALSGDLDAIVLHAIRKAPDERYRSAAALADDLGRYLAGRPVEAREPALGYVVRKLAVRHKTAFLTAAAALVITVVLLGASVWQARVARGERDRARSEAVKAQQIATFLTNIFNGANPVQARGATVTARDLLDRGTASIDSLLKDQPETQASLLLVMSDAYNRASASAKALELAERSLALRQRLFPAESLEVAESSYIVGYTLRKLGRAGAALPHLEHALNAREKLLGPSDHKVAEVLSQVALVRRTLGQAGTREILERAIRIEEQIDPRSAFLGSLYNNLATVLHVRGELADARRAYERSIAVYGTSNEAESWGVVMPLLNFGTLLREQEDLVAAQRLFERVLEIDEATFGKESDGVAYVLACLGDLARAQGDLPRARDLLDRSLDLYAKTMPPDALDIAAPLTYMGQTLIAEERAAEALPPLERALRIKENSHGKDHAQVAEILVDVARARAMIDGAAAGEPLLRQALMIQRKSLSADHVLFVPTLTALARLVAPQDATEARRLLEEAVRIAAARLPPAHSQRVEAERLLTTLR